MRLSLYAPSKQVKRTALAPGRTPAASSSAESLTPSNGVSGTRQPVTHWTSRTMRVCGSACEGGERVRRRAVDQAVHGEAVVGGGPLGYGGGDRVVAEAAAVGEQAGEAGGVLVGDGAQPVLQRALENGGGRHPGGAEAEHGQDQTAADGRAALVGSGTVHLPIRTPAAVPSPGAAGVRHSSVRRRGGPGQRGSGPPSAAFSSWNASLPRPILAWTSGLVRRSTAP